MGAKIASRTRRYALRHHERAACTWCGTAVEPDDGVPRGRAGGRAQGGVLPARARRAVGDPGRRTGSPARSRARSHNGLGRCAQCATRSTRASCSLVRHRGEHRIADAFCGTPICSSGRRPAGAGAAPARSARIAPSTRRRRTDGTIVLVHGAWHGAWCYDALARDLAAAGHEVDTFDLPGHGADATPHDQSRSTPTPSASRRSSARRASRSSSSATAWAGSW